MAIVQLPMSLRDLSHELRTPLTGILGNAELLKTENLSSWQESCVLEILRAGDALLKLADILLEAKKLDEKRILNILAKNEINKN